MIPFRVYDRENKQMYIVLNHHPGDAGGQYLVARESDESEMDGTMDLIAAETLASFKLVDLLESDDGFSG